VTNKLHPRKVHSRVDHVEQAKAGAFATSVMSLQSCPRRLWYWRYSEEENPSCCVLLHRLIMMHNVFQLHIRSRLRTPAQESLRFVVCGRASAMVIKGGTRSEF